MKVIEKRDTQTINFEEVCLGDCFTYGGCYYLRIEEMPFGGTKINAVDVEDGTTTAFHNKDRVTPIDAELVIS